MPVTSCCNSLLTNALKFKKLKFIWTMKNATTKNKRSYKKQTNKKLQQSTALTLTMTPDTMEATRFLFSPSSIQSHLGTEQLSRNPDILTSSWLSLQCPGYDLQNSVICAQWHDLLYNNQYTLWLASNFVFYH